MEQDGCAGPRKQTAYQPAPIFKGRNQEGRHLGWKPLTSLPQSSLPRWTQQSLALLLFSSHLQRRVATVSPTCPLLLPCRHPLLHLLCALTEKGEGCPHHPTNPHHSLTKVGAPQRRLEAQRSCGFNTKTVQILNLLLQPLTSRGRSAVPRTQPRTHALWLRIDVAMPSIAFTEGRGGNRSISLRGGRWKWDGDPSAWGHFDHPADPILQV